MLVLLVALIHFSFSSGYTPPVSNVLYTTTLKNIECPCNKSADLDVSEIKLSIINFETGTSYYVLLSDAINTIKSSSDFNESQCIQFYVPGFENSSVPDIECAMPKMTCDNGMKPLGIIVDHTAYTGGTLITDLVMLIPLYQRAVMYSKSIGNQLGDFLKNLIELVNLKIIDVIGHSLGAHIVGYMTQTLYNITGTKLPRVYGADPAGPCFEECPDESLRSGQADTVFCYHCNSNQLGTSLRICDYDMVSYDGLNQQNCGNGSIEFLTDFYDSACSHLTCVSVLIEPNCSNEEGAGIWVAKQCSRTEDYFSGACDDNATMLAGYRIDPTGPPGQYYFTPYSNLTCYEGVLDFFLLQPLF